MGGRVRGWARGLRVVKHKYATSAADKSHANLPPRNAGALSIASSRKETAWRYRLRGTTDLHTRVCAWDVVCPAALV